MREAEEHSFATSLVAAPALSTALKADLAFTVSLPQHHDKAKQNNGSMLCEPDLLKSRFNGVARWRRQDYTSLLGA